MSRTPTRPDDASPPAPGRAPAPGKKSLFRRAGRRAGSARANYLDYLARDVEQRLKASLHNVRFIDIGVDERLNATVPWHFKAFDEQQRFATFDEAFEYYEGRVLLLGTPGSGKTTTLLNLARRLIAEAQQDEAAPVPLLFNLSEFASVPQKKVAQEVSWLRRRKEPDEENPARVFERWLVQMLVKMPVEGLSRQTAQQWVESGETALLLDGLDEVRDTYVLALAEILNKSYFRAHLSQTVVVCSRVIEYQPLQENEDAQLRLNGGVTLQPPTREQIDSYLEEADALGLRDALRDDEVLYEMAQTPLTLSMMTLAYGGQAPTDLPHDLPFLERRRELLDLYVRRMVQRTARRPLGIQFDPDPAKDVPPRYSLDETFHYLGWLAVKLSERTRTLFPPGRLYSFLGETPAEVEARAAGVRYGVAAVAAWLIALLTSAGLLAGAGLPPHWLWLALLPLLAPLAVLLAALDVGTRGNERWHGKAQFAVAVLIIVLLFLSFGLVNRALLAALPWPLHPAVSAVVGLAVLAFVALLDSATDDKVGREKARAAAWRWAKFLLALAAAGAIAGAAAGAAFSPYGVAVAGYAITFWLLKSSEYEDTPLWRYALSFILISAGAVAFTYAAGRLIGRYELLALAGAVTILFGTLSSADKWVGVPLSLAPAVVAANALGGPAAAVWAGGGVLLFHLGWLRTQAARAAEWLLLNPLLRVMLALGNRTCFRFKAFLDYSAETMLLKHVGTEYEFVHRLLRDHFAIRELIPVLSRAEGEKRIEVIQRLSRQGDSSLEALANLTTHADANVRRAAVEGLGRIAVPKVLLIMLERVQKDPDEGVRAAVVQSLGKFKREEQMEIFALAMRDASVEVRRATVAVCRNMELLGDALSDESEIVFRRALASIGEMAFFYLRPESRSEDMVRRAGEALRDADALVAVGAAIVLPTLYRYMAVYKEGRSTTLTASMTQMLPALLDRCRDKNPEVRKRMVEAVSVITELNPEMRGRPEVASALMSALKDRDPDVSRPAIPGLASLGSPEALAALRESLNRGDDEYRGPVIEALGKARDPLAVPALMRELGNPKLRHPAAAALGHIGDRSVVPELMRWLEGGRQSRQIPAVMTLAILRVGAAAPRLRQLFAGQPERGRRRLGFSPWAQAEDVRPYAAKALGVLNDMEALPALLDVSPRQPSSLLFARVQALRHYPQEAGAREALIQKIKQLPPAEQEELRDKARAYLREDVPPQLANGGEAWELVSYLMDNPYQGTSWKVWEKDWLFFIRSHEVI